MLDSGYSSSKCAVEDTPVASLIEFANIPSRLNCSKLAIRLFEG